MSGRFGELVRHFFGRFFDNELVSAGGEARLTVTNALALLAAPGIIYTFFLLPKYAWAAFMKPEARALATLGDKFFYIYYCMLVIGFVTVLEWDSLFPDRRDHAILAPLPIRTGSIFAAKFAALCIFLGCFTLATSAVGTVLYPALCGDKGTSLLSFLYMAGVHGVTVTAAGATVFFFFVGLQGVLMNAFNARWFRRISVAVQFVSMLGLLFLLLLFPRLYVMLGPAVRKNHRELYLFPPAWFLGLYEKLGGTHTAVYDELARRAVLALTCVLGLALLAYAASYARFLKRSLDIPARVAGLAWLYRGLRRATDACLVRHPLEQASFYFVGKTMVRNAKHRLFLAAYVGVGFALVLETLVAVILRSRDAASYAPALRSVPLVLSFFLLSGMRFVFAIPAELRANWAFRLAGCEDRKECLEGTRKAMAAFAIAPLFGVLLPLYALLWGWTAAAAHILYGFTLSLVLMEILLLNFQKIPFTCSYLPGKAQTPQRWLLYWFGFTTYAYSMAHAEVWLMRNPVRLLVFYGLAGLALWSLRAWRHSDAESFRFIFEDEAEPVVRTLDLTP